MSRYLSPGLLAVGLGLTATACSQPDLNTNLRPAGPPDVLAVLTQNPIDNQGNSLTENALKCKYVGGKRDPKGPGFVGDAITGGAVVCPDNEADFTPATVDPRIVGGQPWAIRVMFDELLNADKAESLDCDADTGLCQGTLATTRPVTLKCGTTSIRYYEDPADALELQAIDRYRSFYVPNGNNVTFPLGPSLFISPKPEELVFPTGSSCSLTIDPVKVTDKDNNPVPSDDLVTNFKIADLALIATDPTEAITIAPTAGVAAAAFVFNANLDSDGDGLPLHPEMFELTDAAGAAIETYSFVTGYNVDSDGVFLQPNTDTGIFLPGAYTATMKPGVLSELNGGTLTVTTAKKVGFSVRFDKTGQTSGTDFGALRAMQISFNNGLDPATLDATAAPANTDYELFSTTSIPANAQIAHTAVVGNSTSALLNNVAGNAIVITPAAELALGTYVVRFKANAEFKDAAAADCGAMDALCKTLHTKKFTAPLALTYNVLLKVLRTIPASSASATVPAAGNVDLVFSGSLDASTIDDADFEVKDVTTPAMPVAVAFTKSIITSTASGPPPALQPHANDLVRIDPSANLTVGHKYEVSIKAGAKLTNVPVAGFSAVTRTFAVTKWTFTAN